MRYLEAAFGAAARDAVLARKRETAAEAGPLLGAGVRGDAEWYSKGPLLLFDLDTKIGRARMEKLPGRGAVPLFCEQALGARE